MDNEEIEIKYYVTDLEIFRRRLEAAGAVLIQKRVLETNLRFDTPEHTLSQGFRVLRLRYDNEARMTYKGPSQISGGARIRQEIEFLVGDFEKARLFLEALGFQVMMIYEKYRAMYHLDQVDITLDELPYGNFIEIEGPSVELVQEMSKRLKINSNANVPASYTVLFDQLKNKMGWDIQDLSFANFVGLLITADDLAVKPADLP